MDGLRSDEVRVRRMKYYKHSEQ